MLTIENPETTDLNLTTDEPSKLSSIASGVGVAVPVILLSSVATMGIQKGVVALHDWYYADEIKEEKAKAEKKRKAEQRKARKDQEKREQKRFDAFAETLTKGIHKAFDNHNSQVIRNLEHLNAAINRLPNELVAGMTKAMTNVFATAQAEAEKPAAKPGKVTAKKVKAAT